jgi:hypothetical protein
MTDEVIQIRFLFDKEKRRKRLKWKDLKTIEKMGEGKASAEKIQLLAARFMADENGQYLPIEQAIEILDDLTEEDIEGVLAKFMEAVQGEAIPKANGSLSNSPSDPTSTAPLSPDGAVL